MRVPQPKPIIEAGPGILSDTQDGGSNMGNAKAPEARLAIVRSLLNNLIGARNPRHSGTIGGGPATFLRRFWDLPRDDFVSAIVYSQPVIVPGRPEESAL